MRTHYMAIVAGLVLLGVLGLYEQHQAVSVPLSSVDTFSGRVNTVIRVAHDQTVYFIDETVKVNGQSVNTSLAITTLGSCSIRLGDLVQYQVTTTYPYHISVLDHSDCRIVPSGNWN